MSENNEIEVDNTKKFFNDIDYMNLLKTNMITHITKFVTEIELSFDYIEKDTIKKLYKYVNTLNEDDKKYFEELGKIYQILNVYKDNIYIIINSIRKIKKQDFEFLNNICLFDDILDMSIFKNENKNTKKTLVDYIDTLLGSSHIIILFKDTGKLDFEYILNKLQPQLTEEIEEINTTELVKNLGNNFKKSNTEFGNNSKKVGNDFGNINNLFENLLSNPSIMNIAQDLTKTIEHDNINPMNLLNSILSGKSDPIVTKLTKTIEEKINNGEIDKKLLESQVAQSSFLRK